MPFAAISARLESSRSTSEISALRAKMLDAEGSIRDQINRDMDCTGTSVQLMAMRKEMVCLIGQWDASVGGSSVPISLKDSVRIIGRPGRCWGSELDSPQPSARAVRAVTFPSLSAHLTRQPIRSEPLVVLLEFWLGLAIRYGLPRHQRIKGPSIGLVPRSVARRIALV
jgi:hypothetical protein